MTNANQIAEWNGALGQRWAEMQAELDKLTEPFGDAALKAASPRSGEKIIDIGSGCGDTALSLARAVGPMGEVLGVDVSRPMLAVARARTKRAGLSQLSFHEADASSAQLPEGRDLLFSRFGVMFFDAPGDAFAHLRRMLLPSGRIAFCCWRTPKENPWSIVPLQAARAAMQVEATPADPHAPGPFAFADADRVFGFLAGAGFSAISIEPCDKPVRLGANLREAAENSIRFGPVGRFVREQGEAAIPIVLSAVETALEPFAEEDGIAAPGAVWIVTARAR